MTRLLGAIVFNWPLKLMAIALATLLYAALVIAQNAQTRDVSVRIDAVNQPLNTIVIGSLGEISEVRYLIRDQANVTVTSANFTASADLSGVRPGPQSQSVRVVVVSADPRIQVLSSTPEFVSVKLENVETKVVPVVVLPGPVPQGLDVRPPVASLESATVRGAQSDVARVSSVRAVVAVAASGIGIDRDVPLAPVDELGEPVRGVDVEPTSVRVTMEVFENRTTATVPIVPKIVGSPAAGFEVARITVAAPAVTLEGDAADLADVPNAPTSPVSIEGRTSDLDTTVAFDLPAGVKAVDPPTVRVTVAIRAIASSRTFNAGIVLTGERADRTYGLSVQQALLTIGGSPVDLDRLNGAAIVLNADVAGLDIGVHPVTLTISLQAGLTVVAIDPKAVTVTIGAATGSPAAPSAAAGG
jgi:YbbR domain-containing protein